MKRWLAGLDVRQATIDAFLLAGSIAVFVSGQKVAWFHLVFLLVVVSAFRLALIPLLLRGIPAGLAVVAALLIAWNDDLVPVDELFELPILTAMVGVVYLTASRRQRLTNEIVAQRGTIEALHQAARTELQDQLLLSQRLQVTNRMNTTVVHDVNNILAGLRIAAETLTDRSTEPDYVAATGLEIEAYTEQAAQIIAELLESARMVNNLTPQPGAAVGEALTELEALLRRLCGKQISLTVSGTDVDATVELPRLRLEQILANLVANAVDAAPASNGSIRLAATHAGDSVSLQVSDNGRGIDPADIERIFEPYFTTKSDKERSGLGLFAVRELLNDVGGSIAVESAVGVGTTFSISLPRQSTAEVDASAGATPPTRRSGRRHALRLLLADDDESFRMALAEALRGAGHQVTTAKDGDEAYSLIAADASAFDVVITDVVMPGRSGVDLAGALADMSPETPVLLITAHEQIRFDHRIARHTTAVRQKPFATADLLTDLQLIAETLGL